MSENVLKIIDEKGQVVNGAQAPDLSEEALLRLYRAMVFNRQVDERMTKLQRQGRISFYVGSSGEEASIIGSALALQDEDWVVPCYREVGAAFLKGLSFYEFVCQIYGNEQDPIKGRQMPCHWASSSLRLASVSSPVGTQIPQATGLAMAATIKKTSEVVLAFFGDGATSTGDFHVACNFAGVFKAPVVFLCRNNRWAISVSLDQQTASENLAMKASSYGIPGIQIDGNDALAMYQGTLEAVERARKGEGPTLIEALTYRQGAHTTSDDPRAYRDDSEVEEWILKDPITRLRLYITNQGIWSDEKETALQTEIKDEIHSTIEKVESLGPPPQHTLFEDVLDEVPWHLREQQETLRLVTEE